MSNTVLIITGDVDDAKKLDDTLGTARDGPFSIEWKRNLSDGIARLNQGGIDIILTDLFLADSQGIETFDRLFKVSPLVPIMTLSDEAQEHLSREAVERAPLHPQEPFARARHRAWIEFASVTLNNIWTFYTAKDEDAYSTAAMALIQRFVQLEGALRDRPYFDGAHFSLVDAAYAPLFRYFDVFDEVSGVSFFVNTPKLRAWRHALSTCPSVQQAVSADYATLLRQFVIDQGGVLGQRFMVTA